MPRSEQPTAIRSLGLRSCGPYISTKLHAFELSLSDYAKAKAAKKRAETEYDVRKAGRDLAHAVQQMKQRAATEEQEGKLFFVEDRPAPPALISPHLDVTISYRWRESVDQELEYGSVKFSHEVEFHRDYLAPVPARKPSAAQHGLFGRRVRATFACAKFRRPIRRRGDRAALEFRLRENLGA